MQMLAIWPLISMTSLLSLCPSGLDRSFCSPLPLHLRLDLHQLGTAGNGGQLIIHPG